MIMQTVNLYDRIDMDRTEDGVIKTETNLPFVPDGKETVARGKASLDEAGIKDGVTIRIRKYPGGGGHGRRKYRCGNCFSGVNRMFDLQFTKKGLLDEQSLVDRHHARNGAFRGSARS